MGRFLVHHRPGRGEGGQWDMSLGPPGALTAPFLTQKNLEMKESKMFRFKSSVTAQYHTHTPVICRIGLVSGGNWKVRSAQ